MRELVLIEILAWPAERRRGRHNPRVVKRKMSNFPTKARTAAEPSPRRVFRYGDHVRIVAPAAADDSHSPAAATPGHLRIIAAAPTGACAPAAPVRGVPPTRRRRSERTRRRTFWLEHVRAWRTSGLSRAAYAQRHGLALRAFHQWIARLRDLFYRHRKAAAGAA
jgi:hypothetical protein